MSKVVTAPPMLETIKAAVVLALQTSAEHQPVVWWDGVVPVQEKKYVVAQVVAEKLATVRKVLEGYGLRPLDPIEGSSWHLVPIEVTYLSNYEQVPIKRKWPADEGSHDEWKRKVTLWLDQLGIRRLTMEYSGSGDSGNPDEFVCTRSPEVWYPTKWNDEPGKTWGEAQHYKLPSDLEDLVSKYVWETLVQWDCVNNEGGGGSLQIDLTAPEPTFLFSCYTNETIQHDHASDEEV